MEETSEFATSQLVESDLHFARNRYKVAVVGESRSGKSSLIRRFVSSAFDSELPVHSNRHVLQQRFAGKLCKVELIEIDAESLITDDSLREEERKARRGMDEWLDVNGVIVVYDTTSLGSFDIAVHYARFLERKLPPLCELCLVGTKCDLKDERKVNFQTADAIAEKMNLSLFEVSAKTAINCAVCLDEVMERSMERRSPHVESFVTHSVFPEATELAGGGSPSSSAPPAPEKPLVSLYPSLFCFKRFWTR